MGHIGSATRARPSAVRAISTHLLIASVLLLLVAVIPASMAANAPLPTSGAAAQGVASHLAPAHRSGATAPAANHQPGASNVFNPPCYKIATTVCISIKLPGETDIVPAVNQFVSSVQPNASQSLPLIIKSFKPLNWTGNTPRNGSSSPIALNVTGVLWNGDPYYSTYDGSLWHSGTQTWWQGPITGIRNNSYPYWYEVNFSARSATGPNFFAGMTITWWIFLNFNNSYKHTLHESPKFQFTYSGAWPYSPYPGSPQYAGANAYVQDLNLTFTPRTPNWNDTVSVTLNTTQADVLTNATIGSAYLDVLSSNTSGVILRSGSIPFPVTVNAASFGAVTTTAVIPAAYAQIAGSTVSVRISVADVSQDRLLTPWMNYTVGGNGSFQSGVFTDDLGLLTSPTSIQANPLAAMINPGEPVNVTLDSRNPSTAINSAEILYLFYYPALHEYQNGSVAMSRMNSITFAGQIKGLPLGSIVAFAVYAWDFNQRLEVSPALGYLTPTFSQYVQIVPDNSTFFFVYVFDNGTHTWVNGAKVQVQGPNGFVNTLTNTTLGVAYPNATRTPFVPLLLPANATYKITVTDPWFVPPGPKIDPSINVSVFAPHVMSQRGSLVQGANYEVVQEANAILFYLNSTPPAATSSPPAQAGVPYGAVFGIVGAAVVAVPIGAWWRQIRARRKEEEKRVTL